MSCISDRYACFVGFAVILLSMSMNMQKILHSYKQWQDYNKQLDIGLMTLYHHQEMHKNRNHHHQTDAIFHPQEEPRIAMLDQNLHYDVEAELLQSSTSKEVKWFEKVVPQIKLKKVQISPLMKRHGAKSCPFHIQKSPSSTKKQKKGIQLGYYDVTQLSNIRSQRPLNQHPFPIDRIIKKRKHSTIQTSKEVLHTTRLEQSMRLASQLRAPTDSPKRMILKQTEYRTGVKKGTLERGLKGYIKTQRSSKPINYNDYKLISLRQFKLKEKGKDHRITFRKDFKNDSKRYCADSPPQKTQTGAVNELNFAKIKMYCKTLMSPQEIEETKIRQAISEYFSPVDLRSTRKELHPL